VEELTIMKASIFIAAMLGATGGADTSASGGNGN
jgi:hypothetical protein